MISSKIRDLMGGKHCYIPKSVYELYNLLEIIINISKAQQCDRDNLNKLAYKVYLLENLNNAHFEFLFKLASKVEKADIKGIKRLINKHVITIGHYQLHDLELPELPDTLPFKSVKSIKSKN